jgi:hypothetical protein
LLEVKSFDGACGETSIGADREADKSPFLLTIQKQEIKEVGTEPPANGPTG